MNTLVEQHIKTTELNSSDLTVINAFLSTNCENFGLSVSSDTTVMVVYDEKKIVFLCSYIVGQGEKHKFLELYNVCTAQEERGKSIASKYLKKLVAEANGKGYRIWLGVLPSNAVVFKLYIRLGFARPRLTNKTALGTVLNFSFISLIYSYSHSPSKKEQEVILQQCIAMSKYAPFNNHTLELDYNTFIKLKKHMSKDKFEVGGELVVKNGVIYIDSIHKGTEKQFTINLPNTSLHYHTHPFEAYKIFKYAVGTPSVLDYLVYMHPDVSIGFVITAEGLYYIQYSSEFKFFLTYLDAFYPLCFKLIIDKWKSMVGEENFRTMQFISKEAPEFNTVGFNVLRISESFTDKVLAIVTDYLKYINSLTLDNLFSLIPEKRKATFCFKQFFLERNYLLCKCSFVDQNTIERYVTNGKNIPVNMFV